VAGTRGAQVSVRHEDADAITQALLARGVIGDHRPPDLVRFGFAPLYVTRIEALDAAAELAEVITTRAFDRPEFRRERTVT
jgi:kynureninase